MDKTISCTLTLEDARIPEFLKLSDSSDEISYKVVFIGNVIPHTCEHCKFWDKSILPSDNGIGKCSNSRVDIHVMFVILAGVPIDEITLYYPKDFGCIFWEGKE